MKVKDFPLCCGIKVLVDFGHTRCTEGDNRLLQPIDVDFYKPTDEEINGFLKEKINFYKQYGYAALMVVLNKEQKAVIEKCFLDNGFKLIFKAPNPKHGTSICYTYVHILNEKPWG